MLELRVWVGCNNKAVYHKRPRNYMCSWDFKRLLQYTKSQLYWQDINPEDVDGFEICNKQQHWIKNIMKN